MPRKSGLERLEEIKNLENIQRALELSAICYAVKPSYEKLKSLLEENLSIDLVGTVEEKKNFIYFRLTRKTLQSRRISVVSLL